MPDSNIEMKALAEAFEIFTRSTQTLEESYRKLDEHAQKMSRELAAKNRELALTNDYLNSILESMSDGVIASDTQESITTFNRAATVMLGYTAAEAAGQSFQAMFGRQFRLARGASSAALRAKSGRFVPVSERDAPIADREGTRLGYVKVFQDLTEIEALREQVRQRDRLAAIGEMAATVAHEIRNPLGGIRGFASLLARDIAEDDPRARLVDKILIGTKDLDRVVNELLEYTRPVDLDPRPVACGEILRAALAYLELDGRAVRVVDETEPSLKVLADLDKMRQVFLNILLNAVQSIEGEGELRITASATSAAVTIAIADTGCGIAPEDVDNVFSPFYTTKEKGTGLGLAVAGKIVESHAGALSVESELGKGTTFFVRLPRTE